MNGEITKGIVMLICVVLTILSLASFISYIGSLETDIQQVDCYDRFANKIQGVTCDEIIYDGIFTEMIVDAIPMIAFLVAIIIMLLIALGVLYIYSGVTGGNKDD